ncbi:hypothetical protein H8D57_02090 [bacterium]|nr:hypothetical protein [bacterium]
MSFLGIEDDKDELLLGFVEEAREMLDELEPFLIELEIKADQSGEVDNEIINFLQTFSFT